MLNKKHGKEYDIILMYSAGTCAKRRHSFSRHMVISLKFDPSQVQRSAQFNILQSRNVIMSVASNVLLLLFYLQTKMCNILTLIDQCDKIYLSICS